jgi:uncharacterized protein YuzE
MKWKADYCREGDVFFVGKKGRDYEYSVEIEDVLFDLSQDKKIIGIEVLDGSKILHLTREELIRYKGKEIDVQISDKVRLSIGQRVILERPAPLLMH